ncbi:hypothetical protein, partial [Vibrio kanaloae]|uniref:hypothetical protein n=1 Tax=Vibrio kanaloae TaxID=170673 RepID=UPI001C102119
MSYKAFINHFNISTSERHTLSFTLFKLIINHVNAVFIGGVITYLRKNNNENINHPAWSNFAIRIFSIC